MIGKGVFCDLLAAECGFDTEATLGLIWKKMPPNLRCVWEVIIPAGPSQFIIVTFWSVFKPLCGGWNGIVKGQPICTASWPVKYKKVRNPAPGGFSGEGDYLAPS